MRHTALLVAFALVMGVTPARAQDPDKWGFASSARARR
jgi:hypothetical protein